MSMITLPTSRLARVFATVLCGALAACSASPGEGAGGAATGTNSATVASSSTGSMCAFNVLDLKSGDPCDAPCSYALHGTTMIFCTLQCSVQADCPAGLTCITSGLNLSTPICLRACDSMNPQACETGLRCDVTKYPAGSFCDPD